MTDSKQDKDPAPNPPDSGQTPAKTGQPAASGGGRSSRGGSTRRPTGAAGVWLAVMALLLAAVAVGVAVYVWQDSALQGQQLADSRAELAGTVQRLDSQSDQLRALQRQLDQQDEAAAQREQTLQTALDDLRRQLASQQQRLHALSTTDRADWLLAEAEYLMRLANQRLLMGEEIAGARDLLKAADDILVELDDTGLYPVRRALAEDMAALRAAGRHDLEGIYFQLEAAARQGDKLTLFEMPALETDSEEPAEPANWQQRLQSGLAAAWEKLSHYIRIQRREERYEPLLAPEYEAAVRRNLRLMFEQAQMAALAGEQTLYEDSLAQARDWLETYYTLDKTAAQSLIDTIDTLAQQQVAVELPDISGSLNALKTYLESRHDVPSPPADSKATTTAGGKEPSADNKGPSADNREPSADNKEPSADGKQAPPTDTKKPSTDSKEPTQQTPAEQEPSPDNADTDPETAP